jgi:hypothetical protein
MNCEDLLLSALTHVSLTQVFNQVKAPWISFLKEEADQRVKNGDVRKESSAASEDLH